MVSWKDSLKYAMKISSTGSLLKLSGVILILIGIAFLSKVVFILVLGEIFKKTITAFQQVGIVNSQQLLQNFEFITNYQQNEMVKDTLIGILTYFFGSVLKFIGEKVPEIKYTVELIKKELETR